MLYKKEKNRRNNMYGNNGDFCYDNTGNPLLEFFSKAGSLMQKKGSYYGNETTAVQLVRPAWTYDKKRAMQLSMWLRDCRGGAGNRSGFRDVVAWIAKEDPAWIKANIKLIPEVGRWDDLIALFDTPCEDVALDLWKGAILDGDALACKWVPREKRNKEAYKKVRKAVGMKVPEFRKYLSSNTEVVETAMCNDSWYKINYNHVPSVAAARYTKAFDKHDGARYAQYKSDLEKGVDENGNEVKVNAGALFPHDCLRTIYGGGSKEIADAQFEALPDYMEGNETRVLPICDFSGSMSTVVSGSIRAIDVSLSLGLYCSDRLGKDNPFYRKFVPFSNNNELLSWHDKKFSEMANSATCRGYYGSTDVKGALMKVLEAAKFFGATDDQIPNMLLIISDMQFDDASDGGRSMYCNGGCSNADQTAVESAMNEWEKAGYSRPKIVYWNTNGYTGSPGNRAHSDIGLVSGFSPSVLKAVLGGEDFTPMGILDRAIEKYEIVEPA
jgi:hypothetical protein